MKFIESYKKYINILKKISVGAILCILAIAIAFPIPGMEIIPIEDKLDDYPDYDYIADVQTLMEEQKWYEAKVLCEDIIKSELPQAREAELLLITCTKEQQKLGNRIFQTAKGFISGNPNHSIEEIGGSIASDMFLYGDLRDLTVQGYLKLSGQDPDPVIAALATLGVATELVDVIDWAPAGLKALRKLGCISDKMGDAICDMSKQLVKNKIVDITTQTFFQNTKKIFDKAGFVRSKDIFKSLDTPEDVAKMAKHVETAPELTHMISKNNGKNALKMLDEISEQPNSKKLLKKCIQKNLPHITWNHVAKTAYKHRIYTLDILHHIGELTRENFGNYAYLLSFIMFAAGATFIYQVIPRKKPPQSTPDSTTTTQTNTDHPQNTNQ